LHIAGVTAKPDRLLGSPAGAESGNGPGPAQAALLGPAEAALIIRACRRTLRRELLDRILILGPGHLHRILAEYMLHYNSQRPHQSLGQRSPDDDPGVPAPLIDLAGRRIKRRAVPGRPHQRIRGRVSNLRPCRPTPRSIFVRHTVVAESGKLAASGKTGQIGGDLVDQLVAQARAQGLD
jgi:integrase-like protein